MSYGLFVGRDEEAISFETICISERLLPQPSHFPAWFPRNDAFIMVFQAAFFNL